MEPNQETDQNSLAGGQQMDPFEGAAGDAAEGQQQQAATADKGQQQAAGTSNQVIAAMSPDSIKELVAGVSNAVRSQQAEPQMSQEEYERTFNVVRVTPELLQQLGIAVTPETAPAIVKGFQTFAEGLTRQAVTMSRFLFQEELKKLQTTFSQEYAPMKEFAQAQQAQTLLKEFLEVNTDLVGTEPLLMEIHARLKSEGARFKTKEEAFKAVAERARAIKQSLGIQSNGQQPTQQTNGSSKTNRMSTLSSGGQGGSGGAARSAAGQKSVMDQVWD